MDARFSGDERLGAVLDLSGAAGSAGDLKTSTTGRRTVFEVALAKGRTGSLFRRLAGG